MQHHPGAARAITLKVWQEKHSARKNIAPAVSLNLHWQLHYYQSEIVRGARVLESLNNLSLIQTTSGVINVYVMYMPYPTGTKLGLFCLNATC